MTSIMKTELVKEHLIEIFSKDEIAQIDFSKVNPKKDILSSIFESLSKNREQYAQFYTHKEIVEFILDNLPINDKSKILDPACGAGAFLIEVISRYNIKPENIFGIDIDPLAISLCKLNSELTKDIKLVNLFNKNSLENIYASGNLERESFDFIIGNPPFKNITKEEYDSKDNLFKEVISGSVNSATLMIARSFELLKNNGYLAFVLPKNLLRVESFNKLRMFILSNFKINLIIDLDHHFKDVRCDQIVLILQKEKLEINRNRNIVKIIPYKKGIDFREAKPYFMDQSDFFKYSFFPLFYNENVKRLADKFLKIDIKLGSKNQIFRGISIGSKHKSIKKEKTPESITCFRGDSIKRFGIKYPLFLDTSILVNSETKKLDRLKTSKIIIQNLCSKEGGIFGALSENNEASLDTVTNIIPLDKSHLKFYLGLLNSKISNFFMTFVIYLNSNFTMHTDKVYIGEIPIKTPDSIQLLSINKLVDKLLSNDDKYSPEFFEIYNELNGKLYELYDLNTQEILIIEDSVKEVMSKKQNGRKDEQFIG